MSHQEYVIEMTVLILDRYPDATDEQIEEVLNKVEETLDMTWIPLVDLLLAVPADMIC